MKLILQAIKALLRSNRQLCKQLFKQLSEQLREQIKSLDKKVNSLSDSTDTKIQDLTVKAKEIRSTYQATYSSGRVRLDYGKTSDDINPYESNTFILVFGIYGGADTQLFLVTASPSEHNGAFAISAEYILKSTGVSGATSFELVSLP